MARIADDTRGESDTLGERYRLMRLLGRGAYGAVFEAEHAHLGRRCAVKILGPAAERQGVHQRFEREARVLARLAHENIVGVIDAGDDPLRGQYLVLDLVRGQTLRAEAEALSAAGTGRVVEVALQIARGLDHAHAVGVIHRDLKPENVMLTTHADGRLLVKILDFGVARLVNADAEIITRSGAPQGTAAYMAPEQARGERELDARVDVFALGVIVYELLARQRPFSGISYNETLFRIVSEPHVPLRALRPDLPAALCAVVDRALHKEKHARYAGALEFAHALARAGQEAASDSLATGGPPTLAPSELSSGPAPATQAAVARSASASSRGLSPRVSKRQHTGALLFAGALGAAFGAGLTHLLTRPSPMETRTEILDPVVLSGSTAEPAAHSITRLSGTRPPEVLPVGWPTPTPSTAPAPPSKLPAAQRQRTALPDRTAATTPSNSAENSPSASSSSADSPASPFPTGSQLPIGSAPSLTYGPPGPIDSFGGRR